MVFYLGYNRPTYTWKNKRFNMVPTYERLDRFLANSKWCDVFPNTMVYNLPVMKSDHAPVLAILDAMPCKRNKPFRFENWWLLKDDYDRIAHQSWNKSSQRPFHLKAFFLGKDLQRWCRSKPKTSGHFKSIEDQILHIQLCPPNR